MSDAVDREVVPLPEAVRVRVVALAADVLPQVGSLPPALRRVADFAPHRRARLGSTPIAAALTSDPEFRSHVVTQVAGLRPELGGLLDDPQSIEVADPADVAALAWLVRPEGWEEIFAEAVRRLQEAAAPRDSAELDRLQRRLDAAEESLRDLKAEHRVALEELKAENSSLRRKLGEARSAQRSAAASAMEAAEEAQEARLRAEAATAAAEAETRKLRAQVDEMQGLLATVRRDVRSDKNETTIRARLLLDTLLEAGQGLRRELGLPAVSGSPADRVESALAEAGTREPSAAGSLGRSSPRLLERYLSMPRARLIIDGYNVSKEAWPDSSLEAQRLRLLNGLAPLVARIGAETTVVFDAAASASRPVVNSPRGVKVIFSPEGVIADDVIRDLVAAEPPGRVVVVVSSDQEVVRDVVRAGARAMSADALVSALSRSV